jgi:hypothetical protein
MAQGTIGCLCEEVAREFLLPGAKHKRIASVTGNSIFGYLAKSFGKVNDLIASASLQIGR